MNNDKQPEAKVGRPKKRDQAVVQISEMMGIRLSADVLCIEDLAGFPDIAKESKRNQAIMCMTAAGFPQTHIAEAFNVSQPTVYEIINRIDPAGMFRINPKAKNAFLTKLAEGRGISALASISLDEILALPADKRMDFAAKAIKISQDLNVTKHKDVGGNRMDMLLEQMASEATDAEFSTEGKNDEI